MSLKTDNKRTGSVFLRCTVESSSMDEGQVKRLANQFAGTAQGALDSPSSYTAKVRQITKSEKEQANRAKVHRNSYRGKVTLQDIHSSKVKELSKIEREKTIEATSHRGSYRGSLTLHDLHVKQLSEKRCSDDKTSSTAATEASEKTLLVHSKKESLPEPEPDIDYDVNLIDATSGDSINEITFVRPKSQHEAASQGQNSMIKPPTNDDNVENLESMKDESCMEHKLCKNGNLSSSRGSTEELPIGQDKTQEKITNMSLSQKTHLVSGRAYPRKFWKVALVVGLLSILSPVLLRILKRYLSNYLCKS